MDCLEKKPEARPRAEIPGDVASPEEQRAREEELQTIVEI